MRLTKQQAAENRRRILTAAMRLFRERGLEGVGVADVMSAAGFTHGGFYNHFASKEALAAEACQAEIDRSCAERATAFETNGKDAFEDFVTAYVSRKHRDHPEAGCAIAALATDAGRQDEVVQASFAEGIERTADGIAKATDVPEADALRVFSELVGAIVLSRAVAKTKPTLANEILEATRASLTDKPAKRASAKK